MIRRRSGSDTIMMRRRSGSDTMIRKTIAQHSK